MRRRHLAYIALVLASLAASACTNPTAPTAAPKPSSDIIIIGSGG